MARIQERHYDNFFLIWKKKPTHIIFLSDMPATNKFCLSASGLNTQQYGIFLVVNRPLHSPVSVSHSFM